MAVENGICPLINHTMSGSPTMSGLMFSGGVVGNLVALLLLEVHRRREQVRQRQSLFHILVTVLVVTDLLGTISLSPLVLASYATKVSLVGMNKHVCTYFGFSMTFFSLSTLAILFTMALERWISIGNPYFYERHVTKRCGYISVAFIFIVCICFSVLPLMNFGEFVQYCPGTWCFIHMQHEMIQHIVYVNLYATLMLVIISSVVLCNVSVICHLVLMYRRRKLNQGSTVRRNRRYKRSLSMSEEVEHMILLVFMTVAFLICSVPLVIHVYINTASKSASGSKNYLGALRLLSMNSIIDPWVYIILSPSVLRFLRRTLCKQGQRSRHGVDEDVGTPSRLSNYSTSVELNKVQIMPWVNQTGNSRIPDDSLLDRHFYNVSSL